MTYSCDPIETVSGRAEKLADKLRLEGRAVRLTTKETQT